MVFIVLQSDIRLAHSAMRGIALIVVSAAALIHQRHLQLQQRYSKQADDQTSFIVFLWVKGIIKLSDCSISGVKVLFSVTAIATVADVLQANSKKNLKV